MMRWDSPDTFRSKDKVTVRDNPINMKKLSITAKEEFRLDYWLIPLQLYPVKVEVGMCLTCTTLRLPLRQAINAGHLQWYYIIKVPTAWEYMYGSGTLGMGDTKYVIDGSIFTAAACPTRYAHGWGSL